MVLTILYVNIFVSCLYHRQIFRSSTQIFRFLLVLFPVES